jgi:hypothetical protein
MSISENGDSPETLPVFDPDFAGPSEWAAMYRAVSWQVVPAWMPLEPKQGSAKRPYLPEWRQYQHALIDDVMFRDWYDPVVGRFARRRNMGLLTGECSGTIVVDLDTQKGRQAQAWWNNLIQFHNNGLDIETVEQTTGGGGTHKLFHVPPGVRIPNVTNSELGVDVRADGGFAVLPPSLHASGRLYAWKPGRAPWETAVAEAPQWLLDEIARLGRLPGAGTARFARERAEFGGDVQTPFGTWQDAREDVMFRAVYAAVIAWYRECPILPPEGEWPHRAGEAYEAYEAKVAVQDTASTLPKREQLDVEDRGPRMWWDKWCRTIRTRWGTPEFEEEARKPAPGGPDAARQSEQAFKQAEEKARATRDIYELLDTNQILALPDPVWLIDELIIEDALGFIFGPPASLKTFIAIGMAMAWVTGQGQWWGRPINRHGAVIYISSEGHRSLKYRMQAWAQHCNVNIRNTSFYLLRESLNFMDNATLGKLKVSIEDTVGRAGGPILAIFVDTVSKVLPGAEENLQKDMSRFVDACAKLREWFGSVVIGIHHTNAQGGFRGSTVIPGAGDFIIEVKREPGDMEGSIVARKIKDAEDGWEQPFKVTEVSCGALSAKKSLVVERSQAPVSKKAGWPDKDTCRRILSAMDEAWRDGKPWSSVPQTGERYAPRILWVRFQVPAKVGREMIETWLINEVITVEIRDFKTKVKGLQVTGGID